MALYQIIQPNLRLLATQLYNEIKMQRARLKPQDTQRIVVGNLHVERFLVNEFLERDGILMGVEFPFLETAIENSFPRNDAEGKKTAGMLELELAILQLLKSPKHQALFTELQLVSDLTQSNDVAVARELAKVFREYLLHVPDNMLIAGKTPFKKLWHLVRDEIAQRHLLPLWMDLRQPGEVASKSRLYLFGMPLLSAYHLKALAAIAQQQDIFFYSVTIPEIPALTTKLKLYDDFFRNTCQPVPIPADNAEFTSLASVEIWALPGPWRGAEIIADHCHDLLRKDDTLKQYDIAVALNDVDVQNAALQKACGTRSLTFTPSARVAGDFMPAVKLLRILLQSTQGVTREILQEYMENPVVVKTMQWDKETFSIYVNAIQAAEGFRDDYPAAQAVYNFDAAFARLKSGFWARPVDKKLTAQERAFDTPEVLSNLEKALAPLFVQAKKLAALQGQALSDETLKLLRFFSRDDDEWLQPVESLLALVDVYLAKSTLTFAELVAILQEHWPTPDLKQQNISEGIRGEAMSGTAFAARHQIFFDLNEKADSAGIDTRVFLPAFENAPTRLNPDEQLEIAVASAWLGAADSMTLAYSAIAPDTGATLYRSAALSRFVATLQQRKLQFEEKTKFAPTMLLETEVPAADADFMTRKILNGGQRTETLAAVLTRHRPIPAPSQVLQIRDLGEFLTSPTWYQLKTLPNEAPVEFTFAEPALSVSDKQQLRFCYDYIDSMVKLRPEQELIHPLEYVKLRQARGSLAPAGFDHAAALLALDPTARILMETARSEREDTLKIEYHFIHELDSPFARQDTATLERRYLPAPSVLGTILVGKIGPFVSTQNSQQLRWRQSAVYPQTTRNAALSRLYLATLTLAGVGESQLAIEELKFRIPTGKKSNGSIVAEYKDVTIVPAEDKETSESFLTGLISAMRTSELIWFDAELIKDPEKIQNLADLEVALDFPASERVEFLRRFYGLKTNSNSYDFFRKFYLC